MRIGDIVRVHDGSWSMAIVNGFLDHVIGAAFRNDRKFRVIAKGGEYPTADYGDTAAIRNDIILIDVNDPDFILFSRQQFCQAIGPCKSTLDRAREDANKAADRTRQIWQLACEAADAASNRESAACKAHEASFAVLIAIEKKACDAS